MRPTIIALAMALAVPRIVAAAPAEDGAAAPVADSMLDVHVGASIARADVLSAKIRDDVVRVLRAHRIELDQQRETRLVIGVGGEAYAYRVSLSVMRNGALVGDPIEPWICECTHEELLTRISQAVVDLVPRMQARAAAPEPVSPPAPAPLVVSPTPSTDRPRGLGSFGKAGVATLGAGLVFVGTGIALAVAGDRTHRGPAALEREADGRDARPAGDAMVAIGAAATLVGAVLLAVDRRRARTPTVSLVPLAAPRLGGISLATRF
jgi:hypothetical protein